jgi:hypothetical protein
MARPAPLPHRPPSPSGCIQIERMDDGREVRPYAKRFVLHKRTVRFEA